jgi:hypothetical protein
MSFLHPEFPQGGGWFDSSGLGSLSWFWGVFECFSNTAVARVPLSRIGNDQGGSRGAQGGADPDPGAEQREPCPGEFRRE